MALQLWRSVFERKAPRALERVSALSAPVEVRQGKSIREVSPELLSALTDACKEANGRVGQPTHPPRSCGIGV